MADRVQKLRTQVVSTDDAMDRAFLLDKFEAAVGEKIAQAIEERAGTDYRTRGPAYRQAARIARDVTGASRGTEKEMRP